MGQTGIYLLKHVHKVNSISLWHHKGLLRRLLKARQNTNQTKWQAVSEKTNPKIA
jgi:hypothetical protein